MRGSFDCERIGGRQKPGVGGIRDQREKNGHQHIAQSRDSQNADQQEEGRGIGQRIGFRHTSMTANRRHSPAIVFLTLPWKNPRSLRMMLAAYPNVTPDERARRENLGLAVCSALASASPSLHGVQQCLQ